MGLSPQEPLRVAELEELALVLARSSGSMSLVRARGFLAGLVSAPNLAQPSRWQPRVLGEPAFETMREAQRAFELLMRLYNQTIAELDDGRPYVPAGDDAPLWCAGYLEATRLDPDLGADDHGVALLLPFAALSGEFDLTGEDGADGAPIDDPTDHLRRYRERLGEFTLDAYRYWLTRYRARLAARTVRRAEPKLGRNDPCSCGSGKKFKVCCLSKLH